MKPAIALFLLVGLAGCGIETSSAQVPAQSITPVAPDAGPPQRRQRPDAGPQQPRLRPDAGLPPADAGQPVPKPRSGGRIFDDRQLLVSR